MQVAIASSDATKVDEHFGKARRFLIYELEDGLLTLLAIRAIPPYSNGDQDHEFSAERFTEVVGKLEGCKRLYCSRIGEKPAEELRKVGIAPVIYQGLIRDISL